MIVLDGRNVYGINKYELKRKNGNNEIRYLVKYKNSIRRGFENVFDAYVFLEDLKTGSSSAALKKTVKFSSPEEKTQADTTVAQAIEKYLILYR